MSISVRCECGALLRARDDKAGSVVTCPKCKSRVLLVDEVDEPQKIPRRTQQGKREDESKEAIQQAPEQKLWICLHCNMKNLIDQDDCLSCGETYPGSLKPPPRYGVDHEVESEKAAQH